MLKPPQLSRKQCLKRQQHRALQYAALPICYQFAASALLRARVLAMSSGSVVGQRLRCAQTLSTCAVFVFQVLPNTVNGINLLQRVNQGAH